VDLTAFSTRPPEQNNLDSNFVQLHHDPAKWQAFQMIYIIIQTPLGALAHPADDGSRATFLLGTSLKDPAGFYHLNSRPPGSNLMLETQPSQSASGDE
jgi:hypothetical protein